MTEQQPKSELYIPRHYWAYDPRRAIGLEDQFPQFRFDDAEFDNEMPLFLVGEADHVVMLLLLNGDNFEEAQADILSAHALKQNSDVAGRNVQRLGIFSPFVDTRQDRRSEKPLDPRGEHTVIVKAQASFTKHLAKAMKEIAGVDYLTIVDSHSHIATAQFREIGIEVINLTTASLMIKDIQRRGLLDGKYKNVICGIDFGNLALTKSVSEKFGFDLAIIQKRRETVDGGAKTITKHEMVYGDVQGKRVILMDDMIDSGGTMLHTVRMLLDKGAAEIIVLAAHPVFGGRAYYACMQELLGNERVKIVMTTNSIPLRRPKRGGNKSQPYILKPGEGGEVQRKQLEILDVTEFMGTVVQAMLASNGNTEQIRTQLKDYVLDQQDPRALYKDITGKEVKPPEPVGIYREGGGIDPLPEPLTR